MIKLIHKNKCNFPLNKEGKIILKNISYYDKYLCLLNGTYNLIYVEFPYLYDTNEDFIVKKLYIIYLLQQKGIQYFKIKDKTRDMYYLFDKNHINNILEILFLGYIVEKDKFIKEYYYKTLLRKLTTQFMISKLTYNKSNNDILIILFYNVYINSIEDDLFKKYKKSLHHFKNYHDLYLFLKKKGYVKKYYENYAPKMIKNYNTFYLTLIKHNKINNFKNIFIKKCKDLNKINLFQLIDKNVNKNFNKVYIKKKFMELLEKNNKIKNIK
jgi:hypothetical protein